MRRIVGSVIIVAMLWSCDNKEFKRAEKSVEQIPDLSLTTCDELIEEEGIIKLQGEPFSGICQSDYPETNIKYEEVLYINGKRRMVNYFSKFGEYLSGYIYDEDNGEAPEACNCDELDEGIETHKGLKLYVGKPFTGVCFVLSSDRSYTKEVQQFSKGKFNGISLKYNSEGTPIQIMNYDFGKLVGEQLID